MRIVLIGQKAFGSDMLKALVKEPVSLVGAVVGTSSLEKEDPVETAAKENGIDFIKVASLKTEEVARWVAGKRPDLIVMAFVTLYMPMRLVEMAPLGAINFHPSLLPRHRGGSALPWTILSGDEIAGLSVYFVDDGLDTGDVIVQKSVEIGEDDFKTLYFKKIYPLGIQAMCEAVAMIQAGNPVRMKQNDRLSSYEPKLQSKHLLIDWADKRELALRKIRAGNPGIGGVAMWEGKEIRVFGAEKSSCTKKDAPAGTVVSMEGGIHVQMPDGALKLNSLCFTGGKKMSAAEFVEATQLTVGSIFANGEIN